MYLVSFLMVHPDSPSALKKCSTSADSNVKCEIFSPPPVSTQTELSSSSRSIASPEVRRELEEADSISLHTKRPSQGNISDDVQHSPETHTCEKAEEAAVDATRDELSTRRRVKAKLGTIDTTFNLSDAKAFPAPISTPRSIGQTPHSVNSEDQSFFPERMKMPMFQHAHASIYEKANPFKSSLSIGIPKSPAKPNPYAGQSPHGNPFVIKSPNSTCSSNSSSKVSPKSTFNHSRPTSIPSSINSTSSSPRPTKNGYLDLRPKPSL